MNFFGFSGFHSTTCSFRNPSYNITCGASFIRTRPKVSIVEDTKKLGGDDSYQIGV